MRRPLARGALLASSAVVAGPFVLVTRFWGPPPWLALLAVLAVVALGALVLAAVARSARPPGPTFTRR